MNNQLCNVVSAPVNSRNTLKFIQLSQVESGTDCGSDRDEWKRDQEQDHTGW